MQTQPQPLYPGEEQTKGFLSKGFVELEKGGALVGALEREVGGFPIWLCDLGQAFQHPSLSFPFYENKGLDFTHFLRSFQLPVACGSSELPSA